MTGYLDRLPAPIRHALIGLCAALLTYVTANYANWGLDPALYPLISVVVTIAALWITPLTRQYGLFNTTSEDLESAVNTVDLTTDTGS
jgi:MFS superfamily sulfate permease-like transporter